MNAREYAERIGRPHGTVKRWLGEGLPHRKYGLRVIIEPKEADRWVEAHDKRAGGRLKNKVTK